MPTLRLLKTRDKIMKEKHKLPFGQIEYRHLEELVDIIEIIDYSVFDDWFNFNYTQKKS